jgi:hypothetical protein
MAAAEETPDPNVSLYLIARSGAAAADHASSDNPALALLSVLGGAPPAKVVVNEMTTVASVWTNAHFLSGKGKTQLGLKSRRRDPRV